MGVTKRDVLLFVSIGLWGCQGSNDMVLQPDTAAAGGGAAPAAAGTGGGGNAGSSAGTSGSAGKPPAAGSGTTGTAGTSPAAGTGGAAGKAGTSGASGTGGTGAAAGTGAAGTGATAGTGAAGEGGEAGTGAAAGTGGGEAGTGGVVGPADPMCDFTGIWIGKQATVSIADGIPVPATSNNWYYLEFKQSGTNVEVSKHYDCGITVTGTVTVTVNPKTTEALLMHNIQTGRKATLVREGNNCKFESARFWSIRGADEMRYLPNATRDSEESIKTIAMQKPLPTRQMPDGAMDFENDGKPGVAFQVTGIISGTRNSVQRDWTKWFTEPGFEIAASADWKTELKIRADFDNEEKVLDPDSGPLTSPSTPSGNTKHTLRLRFLGRDASDPRVASIVKASQVDTCFAIQDAIPAETLE